MCSWQTKLYHSYLELSSSVRIPAVIFVPVPQLFFGFVFAADHSTYHREGKAEEKGPEADDFDEEPYSAILLDFLAALAVVAHVDHMHDSVYDNSKQSVESRNVPDPSPFHADAYNGEYDRTSYPFHHVIEGEHEEWKVKNVARFFRPLCYFASCIPDGLADYVSISIRIEIDNGYSSYELC